MTTRTYPCEGCGVMVTRAIGDEGRGRFCSIKCARAHQPMPTRAERFWTKVKKTDGCWEWHGARSQGGYGELRTNYRLERAHRVSWTIHFGPIPDGLLVCHHCDNPPCVRPDHLFLGTGAMNTRDRDRKGRHRTLRGDEHPQRIDPSKVIRGSAHGNARLTEDQVRLIREERIRGVSIGLLARRFNVSEPTISAVATRRRWKHVP